MKDNKKIAVLLLGAPGSGKGTQGEILEKRTGFKRYVMSSLIKEEMQKKDVLKDYDITSGKLLGDVEIFQIFRNYFKGEDKVIIDGVPRTLDQAYWLYGYLKQHGYEIKVLYIKVDESKLLERVVERGRKDDDPQIFKERLEIFRKVKQVILQVYESEVTRVNGDLDIEGVSLNIKENFM